MSTINTQYRNYVFPLKDEDLESSNNLLKITTEAIDTDMNTLFTTKADSADTVSETTVDTKISDAITQYDTNLDIYGTYVNGDANTDATESNKLVLKTVMGSPGSYSKVTVNEKGLVVTAGDANKEDIADFTETDYVHILGTETVSGDKEFSGTVNFSGAVNLPGDTSVDPSSIFDDTSTNSTSKGWTANKIFTYISGYVPLTTFGDQAILDKVKNVDGAGSGLDADLLDGQQGSYYLDWSNLSGVPTTVSGYGITDAYTKGEVDTLVSTSEQGIKFSVADIAARNALVAEANDLCVVQSDRIVYSYDGSNWSSFFALDGIHTHAFSSLSSKPTTISGYGITDAFDGAFSSLSSKPTTISGYGITDAISFNTNNNITSATNVDIDFSVAENQTIVLDTNVTFTTSNLVQAQRGSLVLTQDATGSRTVTFPASFKFPSGTTPTLTTTADAIDKIDYVISGSNVLCTFTADFS